MSRRSHYLPLDLCLRRYHSRLRPVDTSRLRPTWPQGWSTSRATQGRRRAVTPEIDPYEYRELHLGYSVTVRCLRRSIARDPKEVEFTGGSVTIIKICTLLTS
jgi:hypothetical protein